MIIEEKMLYDFLNDATQHERHFNRGRQKCFLIKSAFDAETDFLYLLEGYYENDPHKTGDSAAYAGVYSHVRGEYFDIPYVLRGRADENKSIEEVLTEFSHATSAQIAKGVLSEIRFAERSAGVLFRRCEAASLPTALPHF